MIRSFSYTILFTLLAAPAYSQEPEPFKCSGYGLLNQERSSTYIRHPLQNSFDVKYYFINLAVSDTSTYIEGSCSIGMDILQTGLDTIILELSNDLVVDSIYFDGQAIPSWHHYYDLVAIPPSSPLMAGKMNTIRVFYHGSPVGSGFFSGLTNATDASWNKRVTYTLSESFHSQDWFPCKQVLTDKADSAKIIITTPPVRMAGSNGLLKKVTEQADGSLTYEWVTNYPVAYYLLSVTVSDYFDYSIFARPAGTEDSILVQNFIYNDSAYLLDNQQMIDQTTAMLELFSDLFTLYPFSREKYGHCVAPLGGGMEHQTMTSLSGFNFDLVSHELAHQWFGDNVTCATWQDIWINEGFASYAEYLCRESLISEAEAQAWMSNAHARAMYETEGSVYVPAQFAENENRIFSSSLSYKKGAAIIHMIRHELNDDAVFFLTLRNFQSRYRNGVAAGVDFQSVLEETSGLDFDWFFDQWYFGTGYPVHHFVWWQTTDSLTIACSQTGSSQITPFFRTRIEFKIIFIDGSDTLLTSEITGNEQLFHFVVPYPVWTVVPDPDNWILDRSTVTERLTEQYVRVDPNPFQDEITLRFQTDNVERQIMLSDVQGKVHERFTTGSRIVRIPSRHLAQGLYIITVKENKNNYTVKLIKV